MYISSSVSTGSEGNPDPLNFICTISAKPQQLSLSCWFLANASLFDTLLKNSFKFLYICIATPSPMDHGNLAVTRNTCIYYVVWYSESPLPWLWPWKNGGVNYLNNWISPVIICNLELTLHLPRVLQCTKHFTFITVWNINIYEYGFFYYMYFQLKETLSSDCKSSTVPQKQVSTRTQAMILPLWVVCSEPLKFNTTKIVC